MRYEKLCPFHDNKIFVYQQLHIEDIICNGKGWEEFKKNKTKTIPILKSVKLNEILKTIPKSL